jgi:hypothetical protein
MLKIFPDTKQSTEWVKLNFQQTYNVRANTLQVYDDSKYIVGKSNYVDRLTVLNRKIDPNWLINDCVKLSADKTFLQIANL